MSYFLDEDKTWVQRDFGLDRRLVKALSKLGFTYPTLVQAKCIPIAMQGKDVLVRAKTGSGKTVAFSLPVLQKVLAQKESSSTAGQSIKCIVLAPTKELIKQIEKHMTDLIYYCRDIITICSLADDNASVQKFRLQSKPDIVITTPARFVQNMKAFEIDLSNITTLVMDEADLVLSFGYTEDVHAIIQKMPKVFQGILMSATLSAELDKFKRIVLHNPAILKLEEPEGAANLLQFYLKCTEKDKFLILYVFIKLGLLQGKGLIFVNDVNKCYKLKLFFQQFFINTAVLNAEVPLNSRLHILEEFNRGVFDYLIATDASIDRGGEDEDDGDDAEEDSDNGDAVEEEDAAEEGGSSRTGKGKKGKATAQKAGSSSAGGEVDYGVSRGIDFQGVNFVVNFDFPTSPAAYTHRVGRTGRGGAAGTALSFVAVTQHAASSTTQSAAPASEVAAAARDQEVLQLVREQQPRLNPTGAAGNVLAAIGTGGEEGDAEEQERTMQPAPLQFNFRELESFRYRVEDTLRSVTNTAVKELRAAELKREILNSERLKSFFAENPTDLKVLRHDKAIAHPIRQKDHLKSVPDYLMPASMRSVSNVKTNRRNKKRKAPAGTSADKRVQQSKKRNPLYSAGADGDGDGDGGEGAAEGGDGDQQGEDHAQDGAVEPDRGGMSGRKQWKMKHRKGEFNPKASKRNENRTPGTFVKGKKGK